MGAPTGFLGLSHLGLVCSVGWASRGERVIGVDPDPETIAPLNQSRLPVYEPGLDTLLEGCRLDIAFTTDLAALTECPLVVLSRDIPTAADNRSDLSTVVRLLADAIPYLRPRATLVIMSQVPPGFTRGVATRIRLDRSTDGIRVYYWVETLVLGRAVDRFLHPERIILGCEDPVAPLPEVFERGLRGFKCPILPMRYESAELAKTAINLYLSSAVTYANTLSDLCERIGADWSEIVPALRLDARIGASAYIRPSLGISGGNLERDLVTLQTLGGDHDVDVSFIDTIITYNARRGRWLLSKLDTLVFSEVQWPTIAVWGLAYKKGTRSIKNSPALALIAALADRADVRVFDPVVRAPSFDERIAVASHRDDTLRDADCLLIMTDWDDFASVDPALLKRVMRRPLVIDCVAALQDARLQLDAIRYVCMGRGDLA